MASSNRKAILRRIFGMILVILATFLFTVGLYIIIDFVAVAIKYGGITSFAISEGYTLWRLFLGVIIFVIGKHFIDYGFEFLRNHKKV